MDLALGRHAEAAEAFERALVGGGGTARDCFDFGVLLEGRQRLLDAVTWFERAAAKDPKLFEPHLNLGRTRVRVGESSAAVVDFDAAVARGAGLAAVSDRLLALNYLPGRSELEVAQDHVESGSRFVSGRPLSEFEDLRSETSTAPIRLGLLSHDLRQHPVGAFLRPVVPRLAAAGFELIGFSTTEHPDGVTSELHRHCTAWHDLAKAGDAEIEKRLLDARLHLLLEFSGHTRGNRLPVVARRLAPVQAHWIGYPNTTGIAAMDYLIGDPIETPTDSHGTFTERVIAMPDDYVCYTPPADETGELRRNLHDAAGWTFGNLGNAAKLHDGVIELWAQILDRRPGSRLLLAYGTYADAHLRQRISTGFEEAGIDPERVEFRWNLSPQETRRLYGEIDIALDTFPYSGGLTTCEAITCGVPVVSLPGRGFAGRHSATHLANAGLDDWVVGSADAYVDCAVAAAEDRGAHAERRADLCESVRGSPLCDADRFAANLAKALRHAVQRWRDGEPPAAFEVASID
jgi:protein O-GlcNAc transferase